MYLEKERYVAVYASVWSSMEVLQLAIKVSVLTSAEQLLLRGAALCDLGLVVGDARRTLSDVSTVRTTVPEHHKGRTEIERSGCANEYDNVSKRDLCNAQSEPPLFWVTASHQLEIQRS